MNSIRWTTGAADQFTNIVERIRSDDPAAALQVAQTISDSIGRLELFAGLGRPGEVEGTRELITPPYVIVYRVIDDLAEVLNIWHGAQDWH